jgi:UDP-glucose 4-epimerase
VYGSNPAVPKREDLRCAPMSPYAVSKMATEMYAQAFRIAYGLPTIAFRFFNVFGPLQAVGHAYAAVIPTFIDAALHGRPLPIYGDGTQTRDFTFVRTVCQAIVATLEDQPVVDGPVNLAMGNRISLLDVAAVLGEYLGKPLVLDFQPPRLGDVAHSQADNTMLLRLLCGMHADPFSTSLAATVDWYRSILVNA